MKRLLAFLGVLLLLAGLCACGKKNALTDTASKTYEENGVAIEKDAFPADTVLKVAVVQNENDQKIAAVKKKVPDAQQVVAYEITATSNQAAVQPDGTVKVSFPIPSAYDSAKHAVNIYYIAEDGITEAVPCTIDGNVVVGTLSHFSTYAVVVIPKDETTDAEPTTTTATTASTQNDKITTTKKPAKATTTTAAAKTTTTRTAKPTTTAAAQTTTTTKEATVSLENTCYTMYKLDDSGKLRDGLWLYVISLDCRQGSAISLEKTICQETHDYYAESCPDGNPSYEKVFEDIKDDCILYQGKYFFAGMGDGYKLLPVSFKAGEAHFRAKEPDDGEVVVQYTSKGDTITITKITGKAELVTGFLAVGDTLTLDKDKK